MNSERDTNDENTVKVVKSENQSDVYDYLNRDGFTSEKFKIEIRGLPKFYGISVNSSSRSSSYVIVF